MRCIRCGLHIERNLEGVAYEELLCERCDKASEHLSLLRRVLEDISLNFKVRNRTSEVIEITEALLEEVYEDMLHTSDSFRDDSNEFDKVDVENSFTRIIIRTVNNRFNH